MRFEEFKELSESYNVIPVYREFIADMSTPVSALAGLMGEDNIFLFESVENSERFGRYSFIGLNPRGIFTVEKGVPYYSDASGKRELASPEGAFMALRGLIKDVKAPELPGLPPLFGGAVGFMGYETVNQFEVLPEPKGELDTPESAFMLTDEMVIFDNQRHTMFVIACVRPAEFSGLFEAYNYGLSRIESIRVRFAGSGNPPSQPVKHTRCRLRPEIDREAFMEKVEKARDYIHAGEVIQLVLSQKFTAELTVPELDLYRALRLVNPSPYTFYMKLGGQTLIGSSPETLIKLDHGVATLRPIAGTRKRGVDKAADHLLSDELLSDEKERAEHLMLVDLGRNDLGRVALPGSVQLKEFMTVERYSHVMHLVSTIEALPDAGIDAFDLVRAAFPAGTLSGAPKVRAMELIHELEDSPRNAYGGAVGYFSYSQNMDLAITIRTLIIRDGRITVQAGAGIVFDSDPAKEYEETCNKAAALFQAVKLAADGLEISGDEK